MRELRVIVFDGLNYTSNVYILPAEGSSDGIKWSFDSVDHARSLFLKRSANKKAQIMFELVLTMGDAEKSY